MLPTLSRMNDLKLAHSPGQNGQNTQLNQTYNPKIEEKNVKKVIRGIIDLERERECKKKHNFYIFVIMHIFFNCEMLS